MLIAWLAAVAGAVLGAVVASWWHRRDTAAKLAWSGLRQERRQDRAREAVVLARDNLYALDEERALKWARKAVRLHRWNPEAHGVLAAVRGALEHHAQAIRHHRRAEDLAACVVGEAGRGVWRLQNALDAVTACGRLREDAGSQSEAQALWDEAAAWARLAYRLNPDETEEVLSRSPWLAGLAPKGGQAWLKP